jgi:hypothetical protein
LHDFISESASNQDYEKNEEDEYIVIYSLENDCSSEQKQKSVEEDKDNEYSVSESQNSENPSSNDFQILNTESVYDSDIMSINFAFAS